MPGAGSPWSEGRMIPQCGRDLGEAEGAGVSARPWWKAGGRLWLCGERPERASGLPPSTCEFLSESPCFSNLPPLSKLLVVGLRVQVARRVGVATRRCPAFPRGLAHLK